MFRSCDHIFLYNLNSVYIVVIKCKNSSLALMSVSSPFRFIDFQPCVLFVTTCSSLRGTVDSHSCHPLFVRLQSLTLAILVFLYIATVLTFTFGYKKNTLPSTTLISSIPHRSSLAYVLNVMDVKCRSRSEFEAVKPSHAPTTHVARL